MGHLTIELIVMNLLCVKNETIPFNVIIGAINRVNQAIEGCDLPTDTINVGIALNKCKFTQVNVDTVCRHPKKNKYFSVQNVLRLYNNKLPVEIRQTVSYNIRTH